MDGPPKAAPAVAASDAPSGQEVRPGGVGGQAETEPQTEPQTELQEELQPRRRPRLPGRRQVRVGLRLSEAEAAVLQAGAARSGMTLAGYAAAAALASAGRTRRPRTVPQATVATRQALAGLVAARLELARVGSNLNQAVRVANSTGRVPAELLELLGQVDAAIRAVDDRTAGVVGQGQQ